MVLTRVPHTKALSPFLWARQHSPHPLSPLSLSGVQTQPHSLPICLWASATAGFCGYFPPSLKHGIKWAACAAGKVGFSKPVLGRSQRQPLAPQEAGYCMQQESQTAAKPGAQTLYMCTYSIGFIALLLGIY